MVSAIAWRLGRAAPSSRLAAARAATALPCDVPPTWRIRDRATFVALRTAGRRGRSGPVSVTFLPRRAEDPVQARVAYAVGRRVGGAVMRNRVRRRLRAAVAALPGPLPSGAYLVAGGQDVLRCSFDDVVAHLGRALREATG